MELSPVFMIQIALLAVAGGILLYVILGGGKRRSSRSTPCAPDAKLADKARPASRAVPIKHPKSGAADLARTVEARQSEMQSQMETVKKAVAAPVKATSKFVGEQQDEEQTNWLKCTAGPKEMAGRRFYIGQRNVTIGRDANNFIQVVDDWVSRVHCEIAVTDRGVFVVDSASKHGTVVNGERMSSTQLRDRDVLEIGPCKFTYYRLGQFHTDWGMKDKMGDSETRERTVAMRPDQLENMVRTAVDAADGDLDAAGAELGVSGTVVKRILGD